MQKKIEITSDDASSAETAPAMGGDGSAPEFADHVSPSDENTTSGAAHNRDFSGAGTGGAEATITALQAEIEDLRARVEDTEKRLAYAQADFLNVSRRKDEQHRSDQKYATSDFIKNLLPVLDNFERALKAAEQTKNYDALIGGIQGTLKQLLTSLQKAGVTPIEAVGQEFDPMYHEAIGHTDSSEHPANTVAEEVQKGYLMHDRVLRPTLVKVSE